MLSSHLQPPGVLANGLSVAVWLRFRAEHSSDARELRLFRVKRILGRRPVAWLWLLVPSAQSPLVLNASLVLQGAG